ncbi:hypothetical protein PsYK624_061920 [Phanerochaete sordida]|uniref:Uncharacterized protein n=1 Tax=Phanerochaete sordida TaxID=48140 RepID=A0A9P3LCZ3_9APHY|nr:hypothetical protein PsYK624_061920 [Phanerochaete sordida]
MATATRRSRPPQPSALGRLVARRACESHSDITMGANCARNDHTAPTQRPLLGCARWCRSFLTVPNLYI